MDIKLYYQEKGEPANRLYSCMETAKIAPTS